MTRWLYSFLGIPAIAAAALVFVSCGDDAPKLTAELKDFSITLEPAEVTAGKLKITAKNGTAETTHELVLARSKFAADNLPTVDSKVDEAAVEVVDEVEDVEAGKSKSFTVDLAPGTYVLFCNITKHYEQGMHVKLVVK